MLWLHVAGQAVLYGLYLGCIVLSNTPGAPRGVTHPGEYDISLQYRPRTIGGTTRGKASKKSGCLLIGSERF